MFDHLKGRLTQKRPTHAVLEVGGVGYRLEIPLSTYERLPAEGAEAILLTVVRIQDDTPRLFGFATDTERRLFLQLIESVSGLGPRKAIGILSSTSPKELAAAIDAGDVACLRRIRGVGPKLAQRLVLELKNQLAAVGSGQAEPDLAVRKDAREALVALGYTRADADQALQKVSSAIPAGAPLEEWIRAALSAL